MSEPITPDEFNGEMDEHLNGLRQYPSDTAESVLEGNSRAFYRLQYAAWQTQQAILEELRAIRAQGEKNDPRRFGVGASR